MIPNELVPVPQWVLWRWVERDGKTTKVPYTTDNHEASSTDPPTWTSLRTALPAMSRLGAAGIGFVLTASDPFTVIDLDHVRDPQTGVIEPWAQEVIDQLDSYAEVSPSGTGVHVWVKAKLPDWSKNRKGQVEVYTDRRYITVTGQRLRDSDIHGRQAQLEKFCKRHLGEREQAPVVTRASGLDDREVWEKALGARNGAEIRRLADGDTSAYSSASEAELGLISKLAFYSQDPAQLDRLFRGSKLMRPKWERKDYRERTIATALAGLTETWTPNGQASPPSQASPMSHPSQEPVEPSSQASPPPQASQTSPVSHVSQTRQELLDAVDTFSDLYRREFEVMRWAVYNLITNGCTLLVGRPKIGKSWLVLDIALAVASGQIILGRSTSKTQVLYLALEDSDRRLHSRLETLLGDREPPEGIFYTTKWCPISQGGLELLDTWLTAHADVGLLIVDTLGAIKGEAGRNADAYSFDYSVARGLSQLAQKHGVALLVVHHDRKAGSDDWLQQVSGTQGLTGAADAILLLRRGRNEADGILHTTGRDVPEQKLALRFAGLRWELLDGDADVYEMDRKRRDILEILTSAGEPMTAKSVAEGIEGNFEAVRKMLRRMAKDGLVHLSDAGWSVPARPTDTSPKEADESSSEPMSATGSDGAGDAGTSGTHTGNGGVVGQGGQMSHCPRCGCEGEEDGPNPTTGAPMRKCKGCGHLFIHEDAA